MSIIRNTPYNIQAEQLVLGAILVNDKVLNEMQSFLLTEHFYDPLHQKIYRAMLAVIDEGHAATPVSLSSKLDSDEQFQKTGGFEFLAQLTSLAIAVIRPQDYAEIVYDLAMRRTLIELGEDMLAQSYNSELENLKTKDIIETTEDKLFKLSMSGFVDRDFEGIDQVANQSLQNIFKAYELRSNNQVTGVSTGFFDLDEKLGGFQNSDLVILAARPGMGKTAFAVNLALTAAENFRKKHEEDKQKMKSVGIFSLEMSGEQLVTRMISIKTSIDSLKLRSGLFKHDQHIQISNAATQLSAEPLFIDDTPGITISAIRTRARKMYRKHNLGMIIIDYLQLIQTNSNAENRVLEVSEITKSLKILARELHIPVIALSQLSRAVDQRADKRPVLSDLRESGSIEQDADLVMFIFREGYYASIGGAKEQKTDEQQDGVPKSKLDRTEIIIAKHRHGPVGTVGLYYDLASSKFSNIFKF